MSLRCLSPRRSGGKQLRHRAGDGFGAEAEIGKVEILVAVMAAGFRKGAGAGTVEDYRNAFFGI